MALQLFTAADLPHFPEELPSGPVRWELHDGRLHNMTLPGYLHSRVTRLIARLLDRAEVAGLGEMCDEVGILISRNPDTVLGPDLCFVTVALLPVRLTPEGYLETMPALVVEVRSPGNSWPELERKAQRYLGAGVLEVWLVDPQPRVVVAVRRGGVTRAWQADETLACPDLFPNLDFPVAQMFPAG